MTIDDVLLVSEIDGYMRLQDSSLITYRNGDTWCASAMPIRAPAAHLGCLHYRRPRRGTGRIRYGGREATPRWSPAGGPTQRRHLTAGLCSGAYEWGLAPRMRVPTRVVAWDSDGALRLGWGTP